MQKRLNRKLLLILMALVVFADVFSQDIYVSNKAIAKIQAMYNNSFVNLVDKEVTTRINYDNGQIRFTISRKTHKDSDSAMQIVYMPYKLTFNGFMDVDFVNTESHPVQKFKVEGTFSEGNKKLAVSGNAILSHLNSEGNNACLLTLKFKLSPEEAGGFISEKVPEAALTIDVIQTLISKQLIEN